MPDHRDRPSGYQQLGTSASGLEDAASSVDFSTSTPNNGSFSENERRDRILRTLYGQISSKVHKSHDIVVHKQAAEFVRLISMLPIDVLERNINELNLACDLLDVPHLKAPILETLHAAVVTSVERRGWLSGFILRISGATPMQAVVSGLLIVFVISLLIITFSIAIELSTQGLGIPDTDGVVNFLGIFVNNNLWMHEFFIAVHASMFGSIVSIVTRINIFLVQPSFNAVRIFMSVLLRPFIASMFAVFVIAAMQAGLLSFAGLSLADQKGPFLAWVIGFLCGFSERFAEDFASKAVSSIAGFTEFRNRMKSDHDHR